MRRLINVAAAASMLLCIGMCVLWARSARLVEAWELWIRGGGRWQFSTNDSFALTHMSNWPEPSGAIHIVYDESRDTMTERSITLALSGSDKKANICGIHIAHGTQRLAVKSDGAILRMPPVPPDYRHHASAPLPFWVVAVPHWLVAAAFALLPAMLFVRRGKAWAKSRSRRKRLLCEKCGYDLRASPGRCPECGTVPSEKIKNPN